jgi:cytosine/adenosine deaminase-related metal-dependent hydrolase
MSTLLAKNAEVLVTMDSQRREVKNAGLYAEDGFIKQVGPNEELPGTADTVIDLTGQIVLPGFINTHHHLNQHAQSFCRAEQQPLPLAASSISDLGANDGGSLTRQHAHRACGARALRLHDSLRSYLRF